MVEKNIGCERVNELISVVNEAGEFNNLSSEVKAGWNFVVTALKYARQERYAGGVRIWYYPEEIRDRYDTYGYDKLNTEAERLGADLAILAHQRYSFQYSPVGTVTTVVKAIGTAIRGESPENEEERHFADLVTSISNERNILLGFAHFKAIEETVAGFNCLRRYLETRQEKTAQPATEETRPKLRV